MYLSPNRLIQTLTIIGLVSAFLTSPTFSEARGAFNGGGGGYGARCSLDNGVSQQMYALDYVQPEGLVSLDSQIEAAQSAEQILGIIHAGLERTLPYMGASLKDFLASLKEAEKFATDKVALKNAFMDPKVKRIWLLGKNPLTFLNDSAMIWIPENCLKADRSVDLYQAVIRQEHNGKIHYNVDKRILKELEQTGPLQLSFTYIHEWLRDFTEDANIIQKANVFLHSVNWAQDSGEQVRTGLLNNFLKLEKPYSTTANEIKAAHAAAAREAKAIKAAETKVAPLKQLLKQIMAEAQDASGRSCTDPKFEALKNSSYTKAMSANSMWKKLNREGDLRMEMDLLYSELSDTMSVAQRIRCR